MSYTLYDDDGETPIHVFHTDRTVCDDAGCVCELPSSAQIYAQRTADGRDTWRISLGAWISSPLTRQEARSRIDYYVSDGAKPILLRIVEDYT
jgi:hypothetical protein